MKAVSERTGLWNLCIWGAVLAVVLGVAPGLEAVTVTYADFSDTTGLTINGSAAPAITGDGTVLRITPAAYWQAGSFFGTVPLNAASFSTSFRFRITDAGGTHLFDDNNEFGADGFVFVVQPVSASIGTGGGGMGYLGIPTSVGVEFDTWHNPENNDPDPYSTTPVSNHLGIDAGGSVDHTSAANTGPGSPYTRFIPTRFDDNNLWYAWVDYNGSTMEVRVNQTGVRPLLPDLSRPLDLVSILGQSTAYVGFTSGTGEDWGNHDILSWTYRDSYDPIDAVPEPLTMTMTVMALCGVGIAARRRCARHDAE